MGGGVAVNESKVSRNFISENIIVQIEIENRNEVNRNFVILSMIVKTNGDWIWK